MGSILNPMLMKSMMNFVKPGPGPLTWATSLSSSTGASAMEEEKGEQEEEANLKHNDFIDSIENFIEKFTITRICGMRGSN